MLGLIGGLAKGALESGFLGGILQTGSDLLGDVFKGDEQKDLFNTGSTENSGLLNACKFLDDGAQSGGLSGNLKSFLDVAKTLLGSLGGEEGATGVNEADKTTAGGEASQIKELLEKLVQAFEQLTQNQKTDAAAAAPAAANGAAPAQAASETENAAETQNQDPMQQIADLLKQLFEAVTGEKFQADASSADDNASSAAASNSASGADSAPETAAADSAEAQNPMQQIADLLKQLLDQITNKQSAEPTQNAASNDQANQTAASSPQQANQSSEGKEPAAAKLESTVQQVLQLMQKMLQAFENGAGSPQTANTAQSRDFSINSSSIRTGNDAQSNNFMMVSASRFEAQMTARV